MNNLIDAGKCLADYALSWGIDEWHWMIMSGCGVKGHAHESFERLERSIAPNRFSTWRNILMAADGQLPECAAEIFARISIDRGLIHAIIAHAQRKASYSSRGSWLS